MKRLLYVDCCIRGSQSRTRRLAEAFLGALPPTWKTEILNLPEEGLPYFSGPYFQQRQDLLAAGNREHPRFRYAWQFARQTPLYWLPPLWDLSFPALLKVYIEQVSVEGITFGCGEAGCYGICHASRMVFLTTRGNAYEGLTWKWAAAIWPPWPNFLESAGMTASQQTDWTPPAPVPERILQAACRRAAELAGNFKSRQRAQGLQKGPWTKPRNRKTIRFPGTLLCPMRSVRMR